MKHFLFQRLIKLFCFHDLYQFFLAHTKKTLFLLIQFHDVLVRNESLKNTWKVSKTCLLVSRLRYRWHIGPFYFVLLTRTDSFTTVHSMRARAWKRESGRASEKKSGCREIHTLAARRQKKWVRERGCKYPHNFHDTHTLSLHSRTYSISLSLSLSITHTHSHTHSHTRESDVSLALYYSFFLLWNVFFGGE